MKTRIIEINDEDELDKFYDKLKIYKWFKHTKFKIHSKYDLTPYETSLNIKNRKKRITYIYDYTCKYVDDYYRKYDMCKFKCGVCLAHRKFGYKNGCCRFCKYQSDNGCMTSNLTCKLFYCDINKSVKRLGINDLKLLKLLSINDRKMIESGYFIKREDMIECLYINSLLVFTIKAGFRVIEDVINHKKYQS